jgi:hypothetical protein
MQKYFDAVLTSSGTPAAGASVSVTVTATGLPATIYSDNGSTVIAGSTVTADASGEYAFYAANGRYTLTISYAGYVAEVRSDVVLFDPADAIPMNVTDYGAKGDGVTNDTAAIQAAINAAQAANRTLYFASGTYRFTTLTISANVHITGDEPSGTILRQISGTNANAVTIASTVVQNPIIENLTIDGNRSGNSSGNGLHLPDHAEPNPNVTYGFSVVLRNVYIQNCADRCLYIGVNRNMGHAENTEFKRGDSLVYITESSDWRFMHCRFGFPLDGIGLEVESGADNAFVACSMFGALAYPMVKLGTVSSSPTKLVGCTMNGNQREGLLIEGQTGIARSVGHIVMGCWFAENGLETDNTYSHIRCTDTSGASFIGNNFRYGGSGAKPKYLLETTGAAGYHEWVGNTWNQTTAPYGTAISNNTAYLRARLESLWVEGTTYLGALVNDLTANSLRVPQGTSGGNYVQIQGRAAGTGPDISAQGADTNINLKIYSKGTGAIEMVPGSSTRAARFMQVASAVNYTDIYGSATGQPLQIFANGTDTNIDIRFVPKGTGRVRFGTHTGTADTAVSGYIEIVDGGGTVRKLAVIT